MKDLLRTMKSDEKEKLLGQMELCGVISKDEYEELKHDLNNDSIVESLLRTQLSSPS